MSVSSSQHRAASPVHGRIPHVVVVDPNFERYRSLAASEREGRISLHLRSSGRDALRLIERQDVDAWLVATDLDDMSGHDFVELLRSRLAESKIGVVAAQGAGVRESRLVADEALSVGADSVLTHPITLRGLESLLALPAEERSRILASNGSNGSFGPLSVCISAAAAAIALFIVS